MASVVPGYEYDIFISYRQKDNKNDGWVTEFVNQFKGELESTFKEDVSVYFDINPHDGLLETHDVDASLKEKLKCLVFIPIISRTYCDPKSFAWEHEFKAFVEHASQDMFGLKVKLPNGNITNRVLPVRIYDLDNEDIKSVESVLGGVLRGVGFIYKSTGINRPLRSKEDNPQENLNHTNYRDQINKLAIATDEILTSLKKETPQKGEEKDLFKEVPEDVIEDKIRENLKESKDKRVKHSVLKYSLLIGLGVLVILLVLFGVQMYSRQKKLLWAKNIQIPAIQKLISENSSVPIRAYEMALEAAKIIPGDSDLMRLWTSISVGLSIETDPSVTDVFWKLYDKPESQWTYLGKTPLQNIRIPMNFLRIKIEKKGYDSVLIAGPLGNWSYMWSDLIKIKLDSSILLPDNMVRIPPGKASNTIAGLEKYLGKQVDEFLMDRYEVTNKEYKRFIDSGGYKIRKYWKYPILSEGKEISWEEAMNLFLDKTGKPGPSTWEVGTFPEGKENHPVAGISWYEAEAYADFIHKKLPTIFQWDMVVQTSNAMNIIPLSNFNGISTVPVGEMEGFSSFGIYDLAGNVREWCLNEGNHPWQRYNLGGGWNDPTYFFNTSITQDALDRSISNGFRCIEILSGDTTIDELSKKIPFEFRDYRKEKPVDDKLFDFFRRQYLYDKSPLNAVVTTVRENDAARTEKATIDAAYNKERLVIYILLPKQYQPPYQPIIYYPGSGAIMTKDALSHEIANLNFIVKSGRALILPVYKSTYERSDELKSTNPDETVLYKEHVIMWQKDIGRTIDYLESRSDILTDKIGYIGNSWGGRMGGILPAVETRIKAVVLNAAGMRMSMTLPEVDPLNFLPRIYQPALVINGRYDYLNPVETSQMPMFDLLGTKDKDKKILLYDSGHGAPALDLIRESLTWFDKYLGSVK